MTARSESSARPQSTSPAPAAGDLGGLASMRRTMTEFSLDGLASLLDDELTLDGPAAPKPVERQAPPPVAPPAGEARLSALTVTQGPLAAVRRSSLDRTHLYKSTPSEPQPTIDLSAVRRSASEPTMAFGVPVAAPAPLIIPMATATPATDVGRSGPVETSLWTEADRRSARFGVTECLPAASESQPTIMLATESTPSTSMSEEFVPAFAVAPEIPPAIEPTPVVLDAPVEASETFTPESAASPEPFPPSARHSSQVRWDEAVESDRQFTTMLLSELGDLPWLPSQAAGIVPPSFAEAPSDGPSERSFGSFEPRETPRPDLGAVASPTVADPTPNPFSTLEAPGPASSAAGATDLSTPPEPTAEMRSLASFVLDRLTPGVASLIAVAGCGEARSSAVASFALAAALADASGLSTLVVDADLRERGLSTLLETNPRPGFADALVQPAKSGQFARPTQRGNLQFLPAGTASAESKEATARVATWIAQAKHEQSLIVVWTGTPDGDLEQRLCGAAEAVVTFAAIGKDRPSGIERVADRLRQASAKSLGVALVRG